MKARTKHICLLAAYVSLVSLGFIAYFLFAALTSNMATSAQGRYAKTARERLLREARLAIESRLETDVAMLVLVAERLELGGLGPGRSWLDLDDSQDLAYLGLYDGTPGPRGEAKAPHWTEQGPIAAQGLGTALARAPRWEGQWGPWRYAPYAISESGPYYLGFYRARGPGKPHDCLALIDVARLCGRGNRVQESFGRLTMFGPGGLRLYEENRPGKGPDQDSRGAQPAGAQSRIGFLRLGPDYSLSLNLDEEGPDSLTKKYMTGRILPFLVCFLAFLIVGTVLYMRLSRRYLVEEASEYRREIAEQGRVLAHSQELYRLLAENSSDGVCLFEDGLLVYASPAYERFYGGSSLEVVGRNIDFALSRVVDEDKPRVMEEARLGREQVLDHQVVQYRAKGINENILWLEDSLHHERDERGHLRTVVQTRDIGERKRAEAERLALLEAIAQGERLEGLGYLAAGIAHDFNNILGGLYGYMEMAMAHLEDSGDSASLNYIRQSMRSFDRARSLTKQLLVFSKGGQPERQPVDPGAYFTSLFSPASSLSIYKVRLEMAEGLPRVELDHEQIKQAVGCLLANAHEGMDKLGEISLHIGPRRVGKADSLPVAAGLYLEVEVRDSGGGIAPEDLPHVFDPFFKDGQRYRGLGLTTAYMIVSRHGGGMAAESRLGQGTTIRFWLPAMHGDGSAESMRLQKTAPQKETQDGLRPSLAKPARSQSPQAAGTRRIIVMDDEEAIRDIASAILVLEGYEVDSYAEGLSALHGFRLAEGSGRPYCLGLFDMIIPGGMGGVEACAAIHAEREDFPIIASSGYSEDPVMAQPLEHGFVACIPKPYRRMDLINIVSRFAPKDTEGE